MGELTPVVNFRRNPQDSRRRGKLLLVTRERDHGKRVGSLVHQAAKHLTGNEKVDLAIVAPDDKPNSYGAARLAEIDGIRHYLVSPGSQELHPDKPAAAIRAYQDFGRFVSCAVNSIADADGISAVIFWDYPTVPGLLSTPINTPKIFIPIVREGRHDQTLLTDDNALTSLYEKEVIEEAGISLFLAGLNHADITALWTAHQHDMLLNSKAYGAAYRQAVQANKVLAFGTNWFPDGNQMPKEVFLEIRRAVVRAIYSGHQLPERVEQKLGDKNNWNSLWAHEGCQIQADRFEYDLLCQVLESMGYSQEEYQPALQRVGKHAAGLTYSSITEIIEFLNASYFIPRGYVARLPLPGDRIIATVDYSEWTQGDTRGTQEMNRFRLVKVPLPRDKVEELKSPNDHQESDLAFSDSGYWFG